VSYFYLFIDFRLFFLCTIVVGFNPKIMGLSFMKLDV
jgi:hypothetical protein